MKKITLYTLGFLLSIFLAGAGSAAAQDFIYTPLDPAFGGSYLNYSWLMSSAKAQNPYQTTPAFGFNQNPLDNFKQSLQRQVLSGLTQQILRKRFGKISLKKPSNYQFGEFSISILPESNGINININDNSTGQQTTVTIPKFQ
jgi:curli production assembly/transport component CsgF